MGYDRNRARSGQPSSAADSVHAALVSKYSFAIVAPRRHWARRITFFRSVGDELTAAEVDCLQMKSTRTATMVLLTIFVAGSALARIYYFKLMFVRGWHQIALEQVGLLGYWWTIAVPAMVITALAYFSWPRGALPAIARALLSLPIGIADLALKNRTPC